MTVNYDLKLTEEKAKEMPMVDLAFLLLKQVNNPMYYRDIMKEIAAMKGLDSDAVNRVIAQLYTEINIDGRFACVGGNMWGLKRWYPVEKSEENGLGGSKRPRIINEEDDDLDEELFEEEYIEEEFEAPYDAEAEDFAEDDEFLPEEEIEGVGEIDDEELADEELGEESESSDEEDDFEEPIVEDEDEDED
jgi:DNA-directed RNA polymerase subunit delta